MLDGFCQRFGFIVGAADPERTPDQFPIYRVEEAGNLAPLHTAWAAIAALPLHPEYTVTAVSLRRGPPYKSARGMAG